MKQAPRHGITMIELLVTVMIIGILGSIAYPSYRQYSVRARRAAAGACLMEYAQYMERVYTGNLRYDQNDGAATTLPALGCASDASAYYGFAFATGQPQQRTYTLQATPIGTQATLDAACATLSINQTGAKAVSGTGTVVDCWK